MGIVSVDAEGADGLAETGSAEGELPVGDAEPCGDAAKRNGPRNRAKTAHGAGRVQRGNFGRWKNVAKW